MIEKSTEIQFRQDIIDVARQFTRRGLSVGKSGNVSVRYTDGCLITPSALSYDQLEIADIVHLDLQGNVSNQNQLPSSEWHFHCDIYNKRKDVNAVIHMHSTYCTTLACAHKHIPAFHYMVAVGGGKDIPLVPYALFGTEELSNHVVKGLTNRNACLMANHGVVIVGGDLHSTLNLAEEVENLAKQYCEVLKIGQPHILSDSEMDEVLEKFKSYGKRL